MKKELMISVLAAGMLTLTGCGSSSDGGGTTPTTTTSQFIDSAVQGLGYNCSPSDTSGLTDSTGHFDYVAGDTCTFKVGTVTLGSAQPAGDIFTPRDLTTVEPNLTNILRFLQTLDSDLGDDIITIPADLNGTVDFGVDFNTTVEDFIATNYEAGTEPVVVTPDDATVHFDTSMTKAITEADFVGKTYTIDDDITLTVSFKDDYTFSATGDGDHNGTWSILDNKLTIVDGAVGGTVTMTFRIDDLVDLVYQDSGQEATTFVGAAYTVTTTPVVPDPTTITLTDVMFIGKTYAFSDGFMVDSTFSFNADHTYTDTDDNSGTWSIQNNILVLASNLTSAFIDIAFVSDTLSTTTTYYVSSTDGQRIGETVYEDVAYTVTDTVVAPPASITLTDDMFIGMTYTYQDDPQGPTYSYSFYDDHTYVVTGGDGDGAAYPWSINTDTNVINLIDSVQTGESFDWNLTSSTQMSITTRNGDGSIALVTENVPYTSVSTPIASGERRSDEPLRAEIRSSYDNALLETTNYTYNDNVVTASSVYDENNSHTETTTYQSSNRAYLLQYLINYDYSYSNGDGTFTSTSSVYSVNFAYDINQNITHAYGMSNDFMYQESNLTYDAQNRMTGGRSYDYETNELSVITVTSYDSHGQVTLSNSVDYDENGTEIGTESTTSTYTYYPSGNIESETNVNQTTGETRTTTYIDVTVPYSVRVFNMTDRYTLHYTWDDTGDGTLEISDVYTYDTLNRKIGFFSDSDNSGACDNGEQCTTYFYE